MKSPLETARTSEYYAISTRQRMIRIIALLRRMQWDCVHKVDSVLHAFSEQQAASRQEGCDEAAATCRELADYVGRLRTDQAALHANHVSGILAGCRLICRQTEAAESNSRPTRRKAAGERKTGGGGKTAGKVRDLHVVATNKRPCPPPHLSKRQLAAEKR